MSFLSTLIDTLSILIGGWAIHTTKRKSSRKRKKIKHTTSTSSSSAYLKSHHQAKQKLTIRTRELSEKHGLPFNRLSIRNQQTRWGSCSRQKNISLNRRLILMPEEIAEYIIVHELAHTVEMNHGKEFWRLVDSLYPERKKAVQRLKKHWWVLLLD